MTPNPWLDRRVLNWAHQGGAREAPSSTLFAMRRALERGADAFELDVHRSADGHLVVCHDATVDATTDGHGPIASLTLAQLKGLDNAYWFVPGRGHTAGADPDEYVLRGRAPDDGELGVATLREVLEAFPGVFLNLDIKQTAPEVVPYEADLARVLADYGRVDDVIVASFNDACTEEFRRHSPKVGISPGSQGVARLHRAVRRGEDPGPLGWAAVQVPPRSGDVEIVTPDFVAAAHRGGAAVHVWTIDEPDEMRGLIGLGVDGVMTDVPSVLSDVVAAAGSAYRPAG